MTKGTVIRKLWGNNEDNRKQQLKLLLGINPVRVQQLDGSLSIVVLNSRRVVE